MRNYERLDCYLRAAHLASDVIRYSERIRNYRLASQLTSCALSISSNIAEGSQYPTSKITSVFLLTLWGHLLSLIHNFLFSRFTTTMKQSMIYEQSAKSFTACCGTSSKPLRNGIRPDRSSQSSLSLTNFQLVYCSVFRVGRTHSNPALTSPPRPQVGARQSGSAGPTAHSTDWRPISQK